MKIKNLSKREYKSYISQVLGELHEFPIVWTCQIWGKLVCMGIDSIEPLAT